MDRSYLSQPEVIAASRKFVCVRLATYEDKDEGAFLKAFDVYRSGELENSVFAVLTPDGKKQLVRAARSPRHDFATAKALADALQRVAQENPGKAAAGTPALPTVANVRLAVNVAACDNQPLVVLFAKDAAARARLEARVAEFAWSEEFLGRLIFVTSADTRELAEVEGATTEGLLVVQHDRFGLKGKVICTAALDAPTAELAKVLRAGVEKYERFDKTFGNHVRAGHQAGVFWQTQIPVTDPEERQAREKGKTKGPKQ
jgi:hypothetical protein